MAVAVLTFVAASAIHFGLEIRVASMTLSDRLIGAAIPEGTIAVAVAAGAVVLGGREPSLGRLGAALATIVFAAGLTAYGLSITLSSSRQGDVAYHVSVLFLLIVSGTLLVSLLVSVRRGSRHTA